MGRSACRVVGGAAGSRPRRRSRVVGRNAERLTLAVRVLDGWVSTPAVVDAHCEAAVARVAEQVPRDEEIASVRAIIATLDEAARAAYGGLNGAIARCAALEAASTATTRVDPMITTGRTRRSRRVPTTSSTWRA